MLVKIVLSVIYFTMCMGMGHCSYMGNETSLRQNIKDLLEGKLNLSKSELPFAEDELSDFTPKNHSEYDFIVIGAGTAGSAVASRLSEIPSVTVLLIEAGGKEYSIIDIPSLAAAIKTSDEINWKFETESSDKYCLSQKNGKCKWPRGKVMGGSSSINSMLAMRGHPNDYYEWVEETGDESWSYTDMLNYFEKLENLKDIDRRFQSKDGPVHLSTRRHRPKISEEFINAAEEMGFSRFDYDGPEQVGFSYFHSTIFNGERWSSNRAYLRPVKGRKNLILTQHSHVHKVLINNITKRAYGVRYSKNGKIYEVKARKEIILSAGAVNSPQILMLSGIGPKRHLRKMKIDVVKEAAVGKNLIDHVIYSRFLTFNLNDSSSVVLTNILDPSIKEYINDRTGILSYGLSMDALLLFNADNLTTIDPNMELVFRAGNAMVFNESIASEPSKTFDLILVLMKPRSRGKILLRSSNPFDKPKIYANYLEEPDDISALIKAIRFALKIGKTNALQRHGAKFQQFSSDCDVYGIGSDKYWECELRAQTMSGAHPVGTCRMGRENSRSAVVNPKLKVIGIKGLRVADASIMPTIPCAHIYIPVIAIGEKAADLIKMDHGY